VTERPDHAQGLAGLSFQLLRGDGSSSLKNDGLNDVLAEVSALVDRGHDPFVTLDIGNAVTLGAIRDLCRIMDKVDTENGMRIEPPPNGQLYYRAFIPDPSFTNRQSRIAQPWELALSNPAGTATGTLTRIKQLWRDDRAMPDLEVTDIPVASPAEVGKGMDKLGPGIPVILVIADPTLTHGQLMEWLEPVRTKCPTVHMYLKE
jgi:hypothetical protein